jgi:alpha-glucuronidase
MSLTGYEVEPITPWEDASGGKGVSCPVARCTVTTRFDGAPGWYDIAVQYFDQSNGISYFELLNGTQLLARWAANDSLPSDKPDSNTSTRQVVDNVALRPGDEIQIVGIPGEGERAAIDYVEITPSVP